MTAADAAVMPKASMRPGQRCDKPELHAVRTDCSIGRRGDRGSGSGHGLTGCSQASSSCGFTDFCWPAVDWAVVLAYFVHGLFFVRRHLEAAAVERREARRSASWTGSSLPLEGQALPQG